MSEITVIQGGTLVLPDATVKADIVIRDGVIAEVGSKIGVPAGASVLNAEGALVGPGFVDLHSHLREPGGEAAETVATGASAGVRGGYSALVAMPNTVPAIDSVPVAAHVLDLGRRSMLEVLPAGAITLGRLGERLAPMGELAELGLTFFTDDGTGVQNAGLMRRALLYAKGLGLTLAQHCEDESLAGGGCMNASALSSRLGLPGRPAIAEEAMVARDLLLAEETGGTLHLLHLSTARSLRMVQEAQARGISVSAEVTPHHFTLSEECCVGYDPVFKVHPPLRSQADVDAMKLALGAGHIDAVATDHAPHAPEMKERPFDEAAPGMLGLETALSLTVEALGGVDLDPVLLFKLLSRNPARIAKLTQHDQRRHGLSAHGGDLSLGSDANLVVVDLATTHVVNRHDLASLARNTPYEGRTLMGSVRHTMVAGTVVLRDGEFTR
jgi:dihydroorotase